MSTPKSKINVYEIIPVIAVAIAIAYFIFGGDNWSPKLWILFLAVSSWIIIMNLRKDAGLESETSYLQWKQKIGFLMVLALLSSLFWSDSLWPFIVGVFLFIVWMNEYKKSKS